MTDHTLKQEWNNLLKNTASIYIYGAGKIGKQILKLIASSGHFDKVKGFLSTLPPSSNEDSLINGISVSGIENFSDRDSVIFVAVTDSWQEEICRELKKRNLTNYIIVYKYSFLLGEIDAKGVVPTVAVMDTRELLIQQYRGTEFNRYDIIVRIFAIENFYGKNDFGMNLYAQMQKARNPNANEGNYEELAVPRFETLIKSVKEKGFDPASEIIVDKNLLLVDGAHRLSLAIFHNVKNVRIRILQEDKSDIVYGKRWFLEHFDSKEVNKIEEKFKTLSAAWNAPIAGIIWPPAVPFADEIIERIRQKYEVSNIKNYSLPEEIFNRFVKGVYHVDNIADWKVDYKINEFKPYKDKSFMLFDIYMPFPDFRIKDSGTSIARCGEDLKKEIREEFKERIENYHPDVIFHTADNFHQSDYMRAIIGRDYSLRPFFESISDCVWMLVKLQSDYLPKSFPDSIPLYKDIDIIVAERDFDKVVTASEKFLRDISEKFNDNNLRVRKVNVREGCVHIRQEQEGYLLFLSDCFSSTGNLTKSFIEDSLTRRQKKDCYWIPDEIDECVWRMAEYEAHTEKKKHLDYVKRYLKENSEKKEEFKNRLVETDLSDNIDDLMYLFN